MKNPAATPKFSVLLLLACVLFAVSCKKDDDKDPNGNASGVPVVTTVQVTDVTKTTAVSGGNIQSDAGSLVTARGVCWSTGSNPTVADNKTTDGSGAGSFTSQVTGLTEGTTYYLRAYATNSKGTGYGSIMVFQTLSNTFTDPRDGNVYEIVTIGNQLWMAENLRYLPSVSGAGYGSGSSPFYYVYDYAGLSVNAAMATANYTSYGVLYNWPAAMIACPAGWHLPDISELTELIDFAGGTNAAGGKLKETGTMHWNSPNAGATNEFGFTARPGGLRGSTGIFNNIGSGAYFWSSSAYDSSDAWYLRMYYNFSSVLIFYNVRDNGYSVRCIKD